MIPALILPIHVPDFVLVLAVVLVLVAGAVARALVHGRNPGRALTLCARRRVARGAQLDDARLRAAVLPADRDRGGDAARAPGRGGEAADGLARVGAGRVGQVPDGALACEEDDDGGDVHGLWRRN